MAGRAKVVKLGRVDVQAWKPDPSEFRDGIVTRHPAPGAPFSLAISLLLLVVLVWASGRTAEAQSLWDEGEPVLTIVTGSGEGSVTVTEYGGGRSWTVDERRVPSEEVGTRMQSRVVGECRCELIVEQPESVPSSWPLGAVGLVLVAASRMSPWLRWRRSRGVLSMSPRPVAAFPVWLRRTVGAPQWAVIVREARDGPGTVIELAGTPAWWLDPERTEVLMRGPDRPGGVVVLETDHGRAVASAAPRTGRSTRARICSWSPRLAELLRMVRSPEPVMEIGGSAHQRVKVSAGAGAGAWVFVQRRRQTWQRRAAASSFAAAFVVPFAASRSVPSIGWMVLMPLAIPFLMAGVRLDRASKLSRHGPLAGWTDRQAAREASRAAEKLDFVAVLPIPQETT